MKKFLPKTTKNASGFTLIELLVVITIIAILAVIGIAAFAGTQKTARDGKRRGDIDAIAKAMETNFNAVASTYNALASGFFSNNNIPTDPNSTGASVVNYAGSLVTTGGVAAKGFWYCATLENATGNASAVGSGTTYPTFAGVSNNGPYYCKASQQSQ